MNSETRNLPVGPGQLRFSKLDHQCIVIHGSCHFCYQAFKGGKDAMWCKDCKVNHPEEYAAWQRTRRRAQKRRHAQFKRLGLTTKRAG